MFTLWHALRVNVCRTLYNGLFAGVIMRGLKVVLYSSAYGKLSLYLEGAGSFGYVLSVFKSFEPFYNRSYIEASVNYGVIRVGSIGK